MSWAVGWDERWQRFIGYGVPGTCDHPDCNETIDRGLGYVCCEQQPHGGEHGCGLYFCPAHANVRHRCARCAAGRPPFDPKPEHQDWLNHVLTDDSWRKWCEKNPKTTQALREQLRFPASEN